MKFPNKIPTILAGMLLLIFLGGIVITFEYLSRIPAQAREKEQPTRVTITNHTDTSFTVSWLTSNPTSGSVVVSASNRKQFTIYDERDTSGKLGSYTTHSVTVRELDPANSYSFKILVNGKAYLNDSEPWTSRTGPALSGSSAIEPAFGTVLTDSGMPAEGALVYLTLENSQTLSTLVKPSGSWLIPLNLTRSTELSRFIEQQERITENILVYSASQDASVITDTLNDQPVPEIVMGKSYDFRKQQANATNSSYSSLVKNTPNVLGLSVNKADIAILAPREGDSLTATMPFIKGTALPGASVVITTGITNPKTGTVIADSDGTWSYTPISPLSSGKQSVTMTTIDANRKPIAITHIFTILKSGSQVLGEATPSGTLTPTAIPTTYIQPTPMPTDNLNAQEIPTSGSSLPTILLSIFGFIMLMAGSLFLIP